MILTVQKFKELVDSGLNIKHTKPSKLPLIFTESGEKKSLEEIYEMDDETNIEVVTQV